MGGGKQAMRQRVQEPKNRMGFILPFLLMFFLFSATVCAAMRISTSDVNPAPDNAVMTVALHSVGQGDDPATQLHLSNVSFDPTIASRIKVMAMSDSVSATRLLPEQASWFLMGMVLVSISVIFRKQKQWEKKNSRPSSSP